MTRKLVIVESPAKAKTIKKFLGRGYTVEASMGHIRDLPKSQLGVDPNNNFEPKYITIRGKGELLSKLRKEAKLADEIFLATDPDREGEAISWHLGHILNIEENTPCRIEFHEITDQAVKNAIKHPRPINKNLVDAQQARRVLDRMVGYKISPLLWRKIRKGLSAGRVQSVSTRILCDREMEIRAFTPEEYWSLKADLVAQGSKSSFEAQFYGFKDKKMELKKEEEVQKVLSALKNASFRIDKIQSGSRKRNPPAPFTTSTLQQEASRKLGFTTKKTMMLAQQLYEGVDVKGEGSIGLLTYIRTDSTRISAEAVDDARTTIVEKFGQAYLPETPNEHKGKKKNIQDAHEAIRPTYIKYSPERLKDSLKRDQVRLYKLIYERFLASQMNPALYETMTVHIAAGDYTFRSSGSRKIFAGYTAVYLEGNDEGKDDKDIKLPALVEGQALKPESLLPEQHFTQPPPRFTEASLVRALEDMGIGRPSTYSPTISTILTRGYIEREAKSLLPTELGFIVNDLMLEYFPDIMDYKFTADLEEQLDRVEEGELDWREIIKGFYAPFETLLKHADEVLGKIEIQDEVSDVICEHCGSNMVIKIGRYGKFLACPKFPECRNTKAMVEEVDATCPKCGSGIVARKSKKGRKFYGCEKYPDCDFISWDLPAKDPCPECKSPMVIKQTRGDGAKQLCTNKECGYKMDAEEVAEE